MLKKERRNIWKNYALIFLMLFGVTSGTIPEHALYIGVVQIIHEEKEALTTIQIKVFSDDLQSVLQNDLGYDEIPSITALCETASQPIETYFDSQLKINVNQNCVHLNLNHCEQINDVHLLTFTSDQVNQWKNCSITAPFFMELFPLQSNIINLKYTPINGTTIQKMDRLVKGNNVLEFFL